MHQHLEINLSQSGSCWESTPGLHEIALQASNINKGGWKSLFGITRAIALMVTEGCFCVFPNSAGTVSIRIDCLKRNQHYFNLCFVEKWLRLQLTAERKLCSCSFYSYRLWEQYHSTIFPTCMVKYHSKEEISLANNICGQGSKETWLNEGKK